MHDNKQLKGTHVEIVISTLSFYILALDSRYIFYCMHKICRLILIKEAAPAALQEWDDEYEKNLTIWILS